METDAEVVSLSDTAVGIVLVEDVFSLVGLSSFVVCTSLVVFCVGFSVIVSGDVLRSVTGFGSVLGGNVGRDGS